MPEDSYAGTEISLWERLLKLTPNDVCKRTLAIYNPTGIYIIDFMNDKIIIDVNQRKLLNEENKEEIQNFEMKLLILSYLIYVNNGNLTGKWVSEKDLKIGSLFFKGVHALPTKKIAEKYGDNIDGFKKICNELNGIPVDYGDSAFKFLVLPKIPLICILWEKDEEFSAKVSYLFDSSIEKYFRLDLIIALVSRFEKKLIND